MALQCDVMLLGGIPLTGAYVRVNTVTGYKNYKTGAYQMVIEVSVFKDAAAAAEDNPTKLPAPEYDRFKTQYDLESADNAVVQAYAHLKTLSQFAGATDA